MGLFALQHTGYFVPPQGIQPTSPAWLGIFLTTGPPGKSLTYPEWKRRGALALPPDDDRDPNDEQQQQHSHCCEHGVSREQLAGPLGQDQAQDDQQENCKGQGGGKQAGPRKQRYQDLGPHPSPGCPHQEGASFFYYFVTEKDTYFQPVLSISEYHQREVPLLTKQEGTSIDNLARFPGGDGAGREPQTLQNV